MGNERVTSSKALTLICCPQFSFIPVDKRALDVENQHMTETIAAKCAREDTL